MLGITLLGAQEKLAWQASFGQSIIKRIGSAIQTVGCGHSG
jgi:hypothetical protein